MGAVLQYNYGAEVHYDDEGYSRIALKGTLEIPLTRVAQGNRTLSDVVDNYRQAWLDIATDLHQTVVLAEID